MTKKIAAGRKTTLLDVMKDNADLASPSIAPDAPVVLPPTPASRGTDVPVLEEWVTALFIMHGIKARWVINYWLVSNKQGAEYGLCRNHDYDEVQRAIKNLESRTAKRQ